MIEPSPEPGQEPIGTRMPAPVHWRDVLLLIFSFIAILALLGRGAYLAILGLTGPGTSSNTAAPNLYGAISMLFCALLLLPLLVLTLRRLRGGSIPSAKVPAIKLWQVGALLAAWAVGLTLGSLINSSFSWGWIVAAPFFILGIAIPVLGLVWIAIGGVPTGSQRRLWAALGIGLALSTSIALALELLSVGAGLLVAGLIASLDPAFLSTLQQLRNQITNANNVQDLLPLLAPYINNPLIFLAILFFVSGIGPLIEEAFKPLAVWFVGRRLRSPAEGFVLGALCGAGFALFEGLLVTSEAAGMLGFSLAARAASSLMHITASGLMGWAIASTLVEKRYWRLVYIYPLSVALHGLWNGAVVLTVYGGLRLSLQGSQVDLLGGLSAAAGVGILGVLVLAILVGLPIINHRLRPAQPHENGIISS